MRHMRHFAGQIGRPMYMPRNEAHGIHRKEKSSLKQPPRLHGMQNMDKARGMQRWAGMHRQAQIRLRFQAELAYLLAQQFIDGAESMEELLTPVDAGEDAETYYIPAMLEAGGTTAGLRAGMILYPAGVRAHRLYLKTKTGKEAGYLSFRDDRLYHIVIPLLEQKRAQVKIEVSRKQDRKNTNGKSKYKNIDFWMRIPRETTGTFPESIGLKIENLLKQYESR